MIGELVRIAGQCDGLRCDMAMLVLPQRIENWSLTSLRPRYAGFEFPLPLLHLRELLLILFHSRQSLHQHPS